MENDHICKLCKEYEDLWLIYDPKNNERLLICQECDSLWQTSSGLELDDFDDYIGLKKMKLADFKIVEKHVSQPYTFSITPNESDKELPNYTFP